MENNNNDEDGSGKTTNSSPAAAVSHGMKCDPSDNSGKSANSSPAVGVSDGMKFDPSDNSGKTTNTSPAASTSGTTTNSSAAAAVGDGMEFNPSDKQLLISYLLPRVVNNPLPLEGLVPERNLYGDQEPSTLFDDDDREEIVKYFFTKLNERSSRYGTTMLKRTVGNGGTWKGQDGGRAICHKRVVFGSVKTLCYEKNKNKEGSFRYQMKEYSLSKPVIKCLAKMFNQKVNSDIVLCRIKQVNVGRKKRAREEGNESGKKLLCSDDEDEIQAVLVELMSEFTLNPEPLQTVHPPENDVEEAVPPAVFVPSVLHSAAAPPPPHIIHPLPMAAASTSETSAGPSVVHNYYTTNYYIANYLAPQRDDKDQSGGS